MHSKLFTSLAPFLRGGRRMSIRQLSTVGKSGRVYSYNESEVVWTKSDRSRGLVKAQSGDEYFVLKREGPLAYDLATSIASTWPSSQRLRLHSDCNEKERILVYPLLRGTLLELIEKEPELPLGERKKVLRCVGEAIQELHSKDWIHLDIKPDNVLLNWGLDHTGAQKVTDVVLGDFDLAFKIEKGQVLVGPGPIGNVMWRSPEAQTARGIAKPADVFAFGLTCMYALGAGNALIYPYSWFQECAEEGIDPVEQVLIRRFIYFGPVSEGLLRRVDDERWSQKLKELSSLAEEELAKCPELRFALWGPSWGEYLVPGAVDMILGMTRIAPDSRQTIDQVLEDPWWDRPDEQDHLQTDV